MATKIDKNLEQHRFDITLSAIFKGATSAVDLQDSISDITFHNYYENNVYPVVQIDLMLEWETYNRIQLNADTVKFKLDINKIKVEDGNMEEAGFYDTAYDNIILKAFDIPRSPIDRARETEATPDRSKNYFMQLNCFAESHLDINKKIITTVLNDCNMKDAILFTLNQGGVKANSVLIDEPDNTQVFKQILMPSYNPTNSLLYFQEVYGVYNTGMRVFLDFASHYVMSKDFKDHDPKSASGEWKTVVIELVDATEVSIDVTGVRKDNETKAYYIKIPNSSQYIVSDNSIREISGENIKFLSWRKGNIAVARYKDGSLAATGEEAAKVTNSDIPKQQIFYNNYNNPFAEQEYVASMGRNLGKMRIPFTAIDLSVFTPNKRFEIRYSNNDYKHLNGTYQMTELLYKFNKAGAGRLFNIYGIVGFERLVPGVLK